MLLDCKCNIFGKKNDEANAVLIKNVKDLQLIKQNTNFGSIGKTTEHPKIFQYEGYIKSKQLCDASKTSFTLLNVKQLENTLLRRSKPV